MAEQSDQRLMEQALRLARRGQGKVEPNPMVGALIVRRRGAAEVVGLGYHRRFGGAHAEIEALQDAGRRDINPAGATMYVTLEPCCHQGKTAACTDALIEARLARVVVAMTDPFDQVAGRGLAQLRQAGIDVQVGLCEAQARALNEPYLKRLDTRLPWVIGKWAQTLDGRIATATGDSRWISNTSSRKWVHRLRARVDAVIIGIGTAIADDPLLTARGVPIRRVARRVVVDPDLRLPMEAKLLASVDSATGGAPLTIAARHNVLAQRGGKVNQLQEHGVELIGLRPIGPDRSRLDLKPLLEHLASKHAATNVVVEGGATLMGELLSQDLVDQLFVFIAPKLLGDVDAQPPVRGLSCDAISDARSLALRQIKRMKDDVLLEYRVDGSP